MQSKLLCPLHTVHFSRCDEAGGKDQTAAKFAAYRPPAHRHIELQQALTVNKITKMCVCGGSHLNDFLKSEHS